MARPASQIPPGDNEIYDPEAKATGAGGKQKPRHIPGFAELDAGSPGHPDYAYNQSPYDKSEPLLAKKPESPEDVKEAEGSAAQPTADAAGTTEKNALNNASGQDGQNGLYSGNDAEKDGKGNSRKQRSRRYKLIAGGGGGLITAAILALLGFSTLPTLRVLQTMTNLRSVFGSSLDRAARTEEHNIISHMITKNILPDVISNKCTDTASAACHATLDKCSPLNVVCKAKNALLEDGIEKRLADDYGVSFINKNGKIYMLTDKTITLDDVQLRSIVNENLNLYELGNAASPETSARISQVLDQSFDGETKFPRSFLRFYIDKFISDKYGTPRCVLICKVGQKITGTLAEKKRAAWAYFYRNVLRPMIPEWSRVVTDCLLGGNAETCSTTLEDQKPAGAPVDEAKLSPEDFQLKQDVLAFKANHPIVADTLEGVLKTGDSEAADGFTKTLMKAALAQVLGEDVAKTVVETGAQVVDVFTWATIIIQFGAFVDNLPLQLQFLRYSLVIMSAAKYFSEYWTLSSEIRTGQTDAAVVGSFTDALGYNLTGSPNDRVDMTHAPLYQALFGTGSNSNDYKCQNGLPVSQQWNLSPPQQLNGLPNYQNMAKVIADIKQQKLVCPEERLDVFWPLVTFHDMLHAIPELDQLFQNIQVGNQILNWINKLFGWIITGAFGLVCDFWNAIPPGGACTGIGDELGKLVSQILPWIANLVLINPITDNMSGARSFDMLAEGADVTLNKSCQVQMGCAVLSNQQVAADRAAQAVDAQAEFDRQPVFARIFSTTSPYSLVSRLAITMPASPIIAAQNGFASFLSNPFGQLSNLFSSVFAHNHAFAATAPFDDPFGVVQYGYPPQDIPKDPQLDFEKKCLNRDYATEFENRQTQSGFTGEAVSTKTESCMLDEKVACAISAMANLACLPAGAQNPDNGQPASGTASSGHIIFLNFKNNYNEYGQSDCQNGTCGWVTGSCSQFSLASVMNSYAMGDKLHGTALGPSGNTLSTGGTAADNGHYYYTVNDVEKQSIQLGVWNGPGPYTGFHSGPMGGGLMGAWQAEASHFQMKMTGWEDGLSNPAHNLYHLVNDYANQGHPVIVGWPNHYLVVWKGDVDTASQTVKDVYLLDNGYGYTYAPSQTSDSKNIIQGWAYSGAAPGTMPLAVNVFNGYWDGRAVILQP